MNSSNKSIDQLLKDKLSDNGFAWNDAEWGAFNEKYKSGKKRRGAFWWIANTGIMLVLGFSVWGMSSWFNDKVKEESPVSKNEIKSIQKSDNHIIANSSDKNVKQSLAPFQGGHVADIPPSQPINIYYTSSLSQIKKPIIVEKNILAQNNNIIVPEDKQIMAVEVADKVVVNADDVENKPENEIIAPPQVIQPVPDSNSNKRIIKKKSSLNIICYIEPTFMIGSGILGSQIVGKNIISANNHSRDFRATYTNGFGINIGAKLNKHISLETGIAQQQFTENYSRNWSENIVVITNKSYTTLKVDTATGKIRSSPVFTTTKHDSTVSHTDKSVNIYSFVQIPLMVYYNAAISKHFNILVGAGSSINIMQLKNRNANELYGYDPTGNMIQPKIFASLSMKAGFEWKPFSKLSFTLSESMIMGKAYNDIYMIKLKQYSTQIGVRLYINNK